MPVPFEQITRAFGTIGCAESYLWRIATSDVTFSPIGSPTSYGTNIDTVIDAVLVSNGDDTFDQNNQVLRSYGKYTIHVSPDTKSEIKDVNGDLLGYGRGPLAGDEIYHYKTDETLTPTTESPPRAFIKTEAVSLAITMQYRSGGKDIVQLLTVTTDYSYEADTGAISFTITIPSGAVIVASYWYDRYYVEEVTNYGSTFIELVLNKVSKT